MNHETVLAEKTLDTLNSKTRLGNRNSTEYIFAKITNNLLVLVVVILLAAKIVLFGFLFAMVENGSVLYTGARPDTSNILLALAYQWDSRHFISIAENGYPVSLEDPLLFAFAPLYPFMIFILSFLTGDSLTAALVVSNTFYFASILSFYRVARLYFNYNRACLACLLLGLFPTYFVYGTLAYSEAPFIFFATMSWYFFKQKQYVESSVFTTLAILTRYIGLLLWGVYFLVWFWRQLQEEDETDMGVSPIKDALWLFIPIITVSLLFSYFYYLTGSFIPAFIAHGRFDDSLGTPFHQLLWYFEGFYVQVNPGINPFELALLRYIFTLPFLGLSLLNFRHDKEAGLYSLVVMLFVLSLTGMSAVASPRIMLASWLSLLPLARQNRWFIILVLLPLFFVGGLWVMFQFQTSFFA